MRTVCIKLVGDKSRVNNEWLFLSNRRIVELVQCWKLVIKLFVQNCCAQDEVCGIREHYK
jgi:hypothetical protein